MMTIREPVVLEREIHLSTAGPIYYLPCLSHDLTCKMAVRLSATTFSCPHSNFTHRLHSLYRQMFTISCAIMSIYRIAVLFLK